MGGAVIEWLGEGWGMVGLILALVVLVNLGLIYSLISGSAAAQWDMVRRIAERTRNPWQSEDEALSELRERADRLRPNSEQGADGSG